MVTDAIITISAVARTFALQILDGTLCRRTCDIADDNVLTHVVSHETTKSGITRSMVKIDESFLHSVTGNAENATAHLVLTYVSGEGRTKAKALFAGISSWLSASEFKNLDSVGAKLYGED